MRLTQVSSVLMLVAGCAAVAPDAPVATRGEVDVPQPPTAPHPAVLTPQSAGPRPADTASERAVSPPVPTVTQAGADAAATATEKKSVGRATETPVGATRAPVAPATSATAAKPAERAPAATKPEAPPPLDLNALKEQLKETKAIGVFAKLTLKNQVDDLLQQFRDFYQGRARYTLAQLRRTYDLLLMKVLSLVQDADQKLASAIIASREAIWGLLADPKKFSTLAG